MGSRYKIRDAEGLYFITFTVVGWVDLFIRNAYRRNYGGELGVMEIDILALMALQMPNKMRPQCNCARAGIDSSND